MDGRKNQGNILDKLEFSATKNKFSKKKAIYIGVIGYIGYIGFFFTGMAGRPPVKKSEKRTTRRKLKLLTSGAMVSARETRTALALLFAPLVKAGDPVAPCIFLAGCPMVADPYPDPRQPLTFQFMSNYWACFLPVVRRVSE